jgi:hypothetical protein
MASVNELAYTKIMLHCAAYPHLAVDGLLVGTSEGATIAVVDAVPLFHNGTLAPSVEAASLAVETYAKSAYGGRVVGYYAANEHLRDESIAPAATPVADEVAARGGSAVVLQVSNKRLADPGDHGLSAYGRGADAWNAPLDLACAPSSKFVAALDAGVAVVDFDAHYDDVTKDWRNGHVRTWLEAH